MDLEDGDAGVQPVMDFQRPAPVVRVPDDAAVVTDADAGLREGRAKSIRGVAC